MALPEIKFNISYYLQSRVLECSYDLEKIYRFKKDLENYLESYIKIILQKIEEISGMEWSNKEIDVWLFEGWAPSISDPLLLNVYNYDLNMVVFTLIHELSHNILFQIEEKIDDLFELECIVNYITFKTAKFVFQEKELERVVEFSEFNGMYKYVWECAKKLNSEINDKTVVEWLNIKKKNY